MVELKNRKAYFDYFILKEIECGIVLTGTEIKSIRKGSANLRDTYARIKNNEVFVINMFISKYDDGNQFNHDERRQRKLLLHKSEIIKLKTDRLLHYLVNNFGRDDAINENFESIKKEYIKYSYQINEELISKLLRIVKYEEAKKINNE